MCPYYLKNKLPMRQGDYRVLVTGGLGFIGCNLVQALLCSGYTVLNIDKLSYASNAPSSLPFVSHPNYFSEFVDITDYQLLSAAIKRFEPNFIFHCAAESHVDNSIYDPISPDFKFLDHINSRLIFLLDGFKKILFLS